MGICNYLFADCLVVSVPPFDNVILQGALRDLSKRNHEHSLAPVEQACFHLLSINPNGNMYTPSPFFFASDNQVDEGNDSDCRTAANPAHNNLAHAAYSEHDHPALVADRKVFQSQKMLE